MWAIKQGVTVTRKKKSFVGAEQNVVDNARFEQYLAARQSADANVLGMDKTALGELVEMLCMFANMAERAKNIPGAEIKKMLRAQLERLPKLIQSMIDIWGITEVIKRCEYTIKIDAHRPRNMPILDLVACPDLYSIGGDFSSFDPKLSKKHTQNKTVGQVKTYMNANIPTRTTVAKEIANATIKALDKNIDARKNLVLHGDLLTYSLYFQNIADNMMQDLRLPGKLPWVTFVDSWKILPNAPENLLGISGGYENPYIIINLKNLAKKVDISGPMSGLFLFLETCETFAHEFAHFVDRHTPNRGALGAQMATLSDKIYDNSTKEYDNNPNEKTPLLTGDIVKHVLITGMLKKR